MDVKEFPENVAIIYAMLTKKWPRVVFTGSRAMGVSGPDSDWDFVVADDEGFKLNLELSEYLDDAFKNPEAFPTHNPYESKGNKLTSLRFGQVNLIVDHRGPPYSVLDSWRGATDHCRDNKVSDKAERIRIFESFGAG